MDKTWFVMGALLGLIGVGFGAFGAHALRARLSAEALTTFETGVRYQMYHAIALLAVAFAIQRWGGSLSTWAGALFAAGILVFSGSLYALALSGVRAFGAITPLGGLAFIAGWACLGLAALRAR